MKHLKEIKETLNKVNDFINLNKNVNYKIRLLEREVPNLLDLIKALSLDNTEYYYLKDGDQIKEGDEWENTIGDGFWRLTGQIGGSFKARAHHPHRRKL